MRQAIEEGFILDVLANYATYKAYWRLLKKVEDDPRYDKGKAEYLLKTFVELHPHAIGEKIAICVEHFAAQVAGEIGGRAKAMIVTRSRLHAVHTKLALDRYLAEKGHPWKALVAFSGTVKDGGESYTESGMNSARQDRVIGERQTAAEFDKPDYRFLVVANKFQTGFDQPLLHTMYVDKKLGGVNAVQDALPPEPDAPPANRARWCSTSRTRRTRSGRRSSRTTKPPFCRRRPTRTSSTRSRSGCSASGCSGRRTSVPSRGWSSAARRPSSSSTPPSNRRASGSPS